ncbi:MAG: VCBS repeat-containing protein, partial [Anaerolineales bacterium]|nr:VCBS repeat-containing protein [Anaerolineales bacterium]
MNKRPYSPSRLILIISTILLSTFFLSQIPRVTSLAAQNSAPQQVKGACARFSLDQGRNARTGAGVNGRYTMHEVNTDRILAAWSAGSRDTNSGWLTDIPVAFAGGSWVEITFTPTGQTTPIQLEIINPAPNTAYGWIFPGQCHAIELQFPLDWMSRQQQPPTPVITPQPPIEPPTSDVPNFALATEPAWESGESDAKTDFAWGDIDKDGDLDLVVAVAGKGNRLYSNENGRLSTTPTWESISANPIAIALADLNQDGWLDLIAANDGKNHIYQNNKGALPQAPTWTSTDSATSTGVAVGDIDGDGRYDLIFSNQDGADIVLYQGLDENKPFTELQPLVGSDGPAELALGKLNDDEYLDLLALHQDSLNYYTGDAGGQLTLAKSCAKGDGGSFTSMALAGGVTEGKFYLAIGKYDGSFSTSMVIPPRLFVTTEITSVADCPNDTLNIQFESTDTWLLIGVDRGLSWVDVNGDGKLDLSSGLTIYQQDSGENVSFTGISLNLPLENTGDESAWADVDGDGDLDVVVAMHSKQPLRLFLNKTTHFSPLAAFDLGSSQNNHSFADIDDDGDYDRVGFTTISPSHPFFQRNEGNGFGKEQYGFQTPELSFPIFAPTIREFAWGDVDGDMRLDLAIGTVGRKTQIYRNTGDTDFPFALYAELPANATALAWGDFDHNGFQDLATGNGLGEISIYRNDNGSLSLDWAL